MAASTAAIRRASPIVLLAAAAGAGLGLAIAALRGHPDEALALTPFTAALAMASAVDLRERRIPNGITVPGVIAALLIAAFAGHLLSALGGLAFAGGVMGIAWLIARGQLGLGDVKLSAFVGAAVGLYGAPLFLMLGSLFGAIAAAIILIRGRSRHTMLPYGPCLAAGAIVTVALRGLLG